MTTTQATVKLPVRLAFSATERFSNGAPKWVIKGTPGSWGDAGWNVVECESEADAARVRAEYPEARMPCWRRMEPGGDLYGALAGEVRS